MMSNDIIFIMNMLALKGSLLGDNLSDFRILD